MKRVFVCNCEGLISVNDNTLDLITHFVPEGDRIYSLLRTYDYIRGTLVGKKGYCLGNISRLVLPFLLAFDADNESVKKYSADKLVLRKNSKELLRYVKDVADAFIISTRYEHHARAICRESGVPLENAYSIKVNLDKLSLSSKEKSLLREFACEIGGMPPISVPPNAASFKDLSNRDQAYVRRFDRIFWKEIMKTKCKDVFYRVNMAVEDEKHKALSQLATAFSSRFDDVMYVGSDKTDAKVMQFVKESGGLPVAFNGDELAVKSAEISILSKDIAPVSVIADFFLRLGKAETSKYAGNFEKDVLRLSPANPKLLDGLFELHPNSWPVVKLVSDWNVELLVNQSKEKRISG